MTMVLVFRVSREKYVFELKAIIRDEILEEEEEINRMK